MALFRIVWLIIALIFGEGGTSHEKSEDLRAYIPENAAIYANVNLIQMRKDVAFYQKMLKEIVQGRNPNMSGDDMLAEVAKKLNIYPGTIKEAVSGVKGVAFGLLSVGEREYQNKLILVVDRGKKDILPKLLATFSDSKSYHEAIYKNVPIYAFMKRKHEGLWMTEFNGKVAFALDPMAIREFILQAKAVQGKEKVLYSNSALHVEAKGKLILNAIYSQLSRYDRYDFFIMSMLLDFASLEKLTVDFELGGTLKAKLDLHPESPLLKVLENPQGLTELSRYVTRDTGFAFMLNLENPLLFWQHIFKVIETSEAMRQRHGRVRREFKELGFDFEKDFVSKVKEAMYFAPRFRSPRDLGRNFAFIFRLKDLKGAEETIGKFLFKVGRGRKVEKIEKENFKIWKIRYLSIALYGNDLIFCERNIEGIIDSFEKAKQSLYYEHLAKVYSPARTFLSVSPEQLRKEMGMEPFSLGLWLDKNTLNLKAYFPLKDLATAMLKKSKPRKKVDGRAPEFTPNKRAKTSSKEK